MQRRILLVIVVFVACFGLGFGLSWLLVGSSEAPKTAVAPAEAAKTPPGELEPNAVTPPPSDGAVAALGGALDGGVGGASGAVEADVVGEPADAAVAVADVAGGGGEPDAPADAAPPRAAWEACLGRSCRLDFGEVDGSISIRQGSLAHGQVVDWNESFGKADKVGTIDVGSDVRVHVVALGVAEDDHAAAVAAQIVRKVKRGEQKGVISLRIGKKQLTLVPEGE